jgi:hypothetical protein
MEAMMWECLTWKEGLSNAFHSVRIPLFIILDQFGLHLISYLMCIGFSLSKKVYLVFPNIIALIEDEQSWVEVM